MWKSARICFAGMVLALAASPLVAGPDEKIKAGLAKVLPDEQVDSISQSPVGGLYEVIMGAQVVYVSEDGHYLLQGRMIDLNSREDLTEPRRAAARKQAVDKVGEDKMIVFSPEKYEYTVTVFTDIDCGYCRKLHKEIDQYGKEGIRVRYVFYPRAGVGSKSFEEAVSVWCADDRQQAMTDAKAGKSVEKKTCDNPVEEHMQLGESLGLSGTPAIVLDSGDLVPGYVPPKRLAAVLEASAP